MFKLFSRSVILLLLSFVIFSCKTMQKAPEPNLDKSDKAQSAEVKSAADAKKSDEKSSEPLSKKWGKVVIRFRTETQANTYGFFAYRGETKDGPFVKVNKDIIPGAGTTSDPKNYEFVDIPLELGKTYYFYLEEVTYNKVTKNITGVNPKKVTQALTLKEAKELGLSE